jgi:predicted membrane channel-forming protein YqfA (hemolysin III family)
MAIRNFALLTGVLLLALGICGFVPGFVSPAATEPTELVIDAGYGYLFGLIPTNLLFNITRAAIGIVGILSARTPRSAWYFAVGLAIFYSILAGLGFLPFAGTMFGLMPIFGNNILLHAGTAFLAGYFAFVRKSPEVSVGGTPDRQYSNAAR